MSELPPDPEQGAPAGEAPDAPAELADRDARPTSRLTGHRRLAVFVACGLAVMACVAVFAFSRRGGEADPPQPTVDAWAPYWALDASLPELSARAGSIGDLSPFFYAAESADVIALDPNAPVAATEAFLREAHRAGSRLVPSVVDAIPAGGMAAVLADPGQRRRHVEALAAFAEEQDAAGLDIDYERFAFADDRASWATTRPSWVAFVEELADRLHADGRTLTVSIPPVYDAGRTEDSGYWVYDYAAIAPLVDRIRVMAYDYSTEDPGPIAPVTWVQQSIDGAVEAAGDASKLVLGIPAYGYNWLVGTTGTCPADAAGERTAVTARSAGDLADRRGALPVHDAATGEWSFRYDLPLTDGTNSCTQHREVHYVDGDGALQRAALARAAGFQGAALWALGYEEDAFWPALAAPPTTDNA